MVAVAWITGCSIQPVPTQRTVSLPESEPPGAVLRYGDARFRHGDLIHALCVFGGGKAIVSASYDRTFVVWDLESGLARFRSPVLEGTPLSLDTSSPGDLVAVGFKSGRACIWDLHVGKIIRTFETPGCWVKTVRFSPDAKSLVTGGSNGELRRWSVSTGQLLLTLKGHAGAILAATYSPSGDRIAISGADKTIRIWEVGGGKDPVILRGHRFVASALGFSPDGSVLASISGSCDYPEAGGPLGMTIEYAVGDGKIVLWNAQTGAEIQSID